MFLLLGCYKSSYEKVNPEMYTASDFPSNSGNDSSGCECFYSCPSDKSVGYFVIRDDSSFRDIFYDCDSAGILESGIDFSENWLVGYSTDNCYKNEIEVYVDHDEKVYKYFIKDKNCGDAVGDGYIHNAVLLPLTEAYEVQFLDGLKCYLGSWGGCI